MAKRNDTGGWVFVVLVASFGAWSGYRNSDYGIRSAAADRYQLPINFVALERKPDDCEFLTAPLGAKHCSYNPEYLADWVKLTDGTPQARVVEYGTIQEQPPEGCFQDSPARNCFDTQVLSPRIQVTQDWRAQHVEIRWRRVED